MDSHPALFCEGEPCPIHHPSDHHMAEWPTVVRHDKHCLVERICQHGVGHPDPDSLAWLAKGAPGLHTIPDGLFEVEARPVVVLTEDLESLGVHGCCGCCAVPA